MNDPLPRILQGLNEVRNKQCRRHDIDPTQHQNRLIEHAAENAIMLAEALDERWLDPVLVIGEITFLPGHAQTVEQAFANECVHQWVRTSPSGTEQEYVVDIGSYTRSDEFLGSPLVAASRPDGYATFSASSIPFTSLPSNEPISQELYTQYKEAGLFSGD